MDPAEQDLHKGGGKSGRGDGLSANDRVYLVPDWFAGKGGSPAACGGGKGRTGAQAAPSSLPTGGNNMASQKEIAKKAGVSVSTVSRVLGGMGEKAASPKIARKIWEAARELGYTPNPAARALRLGETDKKDPDRNRSRFGNLSRSRSCVRAGPKSAAGHHRPLLPSPGNLPRRRASFVLHRRPDRRTGLCGTSGCGALPGVCISFPETSAGQAGT